MRQMLQDEDAVHSPDSIWAVKAARLVDGTGDNPVHDAVLLIKSDKILAAGSASKIPISPRTTTVDLGEETLMPGFIDTHSHLTLKPIGTGDLDSYVSQFYDPEARLTARALRQMRIDLLSGVTTVRVVGELSFVDVTLAADVEIGAILGPRIIPSGPRLAPSGGHVWIPEWCVDGTENIRRTVRNYVSRGARLIKVGLLDEDKERTSYSADELGALVDEAHQLGVPVAAHCTGKWGSSIRCSLRAGVDTIEHVVPLNEEVVDWFADSDAAMSLTPFVYQMDWPQPESYWYHQDRVAQSAKEWMDYNAAVRDSFLRHHGEVLTQDRLYGGREVFPAVDAYMRGIRLAWEAGIDLAVGSDAPHGVFGLNIEFIVEAGIPPLQAITAATGVAARISKIDKITGTLVPGKAADFISVRGNPLDDIKAVRDIHLIVRNGIRYDSLSYT